MRVKKIITGLSIPREYCCLNQFDLYSSLRVDFVCGNKTAPRDVTDSHLFLGYKPLIIGLPLKLSHERDAANSGEGVAWLRFHDGNSNPLAAIRLKKICQKTYDQSALVLYKGEQGTHKFLSKYHQLIHRLREAIRRRPSTNVSLKGNLYDQVRIAYSVPRIIAIITVKHDHLMNMFPTDLHGVIDKFHYISSLRTGGKANDQVEKNRRIAISYVDASAYKDTYALGKNHMQPMSGYESFTLSTAHSKIFQIPLPEKTNEYFELELRESVDVGIHRLHVYKIVYHHCDESKGSRLAHIHQYYAQWRHDHALPTNLFYP